MKSVMKILIAAICILLFFGNCSKSKDSSTNYLRGKIDGVPFECTERINATGGDNFGMSIWGGWSVSGIKLGITRSGGSITTGAYDFHKDTYNYANIYDGVFSYYAGSDFLLTSFGGSGRITILEISKEYVKGTFEFITEPNPMPSKKVTNGEFYIKRSY